MNEDGRVIDDLVDSRSGETTMPEGELLGNLSRNIRSGIQVLTMVAYLAVAASMARSARVEAGTSVPSNPTLTSEARPNSEASTVKIDSEDKLMESLMRRQDLRDIWKQEGRHMSKESLMEMQRLELYHATLVVERLKTSNILTTESYGRFLSSLESIGHLNDQQFDSRFGAITGRTEELQIEIADICNHAVSAHNRMLELSKTENWQEEFDRLTIDIMSHGRSVNDRVLEYESLVNDVSKEIMNILRDKESR